MADAITIKALQDASLDAKSLAEFVFKPASFMVQRRLAPSINTLQYYIDLFENISIGGEFNSAKIESLTVNTGEAGTQASVVTGGTPSNRTFALTIPRGDKGVDGKSAYQSALDNGFIGTEAEWKLYLKSDGSIQALQQFMTNPASTEVSVPDYGNIPSLQGYISTMFENGGLPATPFATKALMTASALVDGDYAQVTDDTVNNGLYVKTAGAWVKSEYDPFTSVLGKVNPRLDKLNQTISTSKNRNALLELSDENGDIYALIEQDGSLYLCGTEGKSVQERLSSAPKYGSTEKGDILTIEDASDNIVVRLANDGHLFLPCLNKSVQNSLDVISPKLREVRKTNKKLFFTDETKNYVLNLIAAQDGIAPMAYGLLPSSYTISKSHLDGLSISSLGSELTLDSPYSKDDEFVHPYIFECVGGIRGYRYILLINPFSIEPHENPVVYGSNDLESFTMLEGFAQPLDLPDPSGFLSDSGFTYDPVTGEAIAFWRSTRDVDGVRLTGHWYSRTKDFLNWSEKANYLPEVPSSTDDSVVSPSLLFNPVDGLWYLFFMRRSGTFACRTAKDIEGVWTDLVVIPTPGFTPWHAEVKYIGDRFVCMLNSVVQGNYYLGISEDGRNWDICTSPLFSQTVDRLYKGSFLPILSEDDKLHLEVFYTINDSAIHRRLNHTTTNTINI